MPLDPYSYVAPSRVRSFLCPLGNLKQSTFLNYAERLVNVKEVCLVDVTPDRRSELGKCSTKIVLILSFSILRY